MASRGETVLGVESDLRRHSRAHCEGRAFAAGAPRYAGGSRVTRERSACDVAANRGESRTSEASSEKSGGGDVVTVRCRIIAWVC